MKPMLPYTAKVEIADLLDSGMICLYHTVTGEIEYHPDEMRNPGFDSQLWEDTMQKVEKDYHNYIRFEGMDSKEAFRIMEDFVSEIPDEKLKSKLVEAIQRKQPFQQFKTALLSYPQLRQQWFDYKKKRLIAYVEEIIEVENLS
jgi:ribulose bisphosphate carboxylase small subunit